MTDAPTVAPLLLTAPEAAAALRISERTLWTLTKSGVIPCVRLGRLVRYESRTLADWIAAQTRPAAARREKDSAHGC